MVKVIVGLKGSGKTKQLLELVRQALDEEPGNIVWIQRDRKTTYDIPYQVRLINAGEYQIGTFEFMKGFISGLRAGNYDITHIFIDNFYKLFNPGTEAEVAEFLNWISNFSLTEEIKFTITMTADPNEVCDEIKKFT
ncbi:MAG: ATP-binding protein [Ruminococcaceae bacterium]|nr:ATP-binding protein [Oscillospiraceae bacterium]